MLTETMAKTAAGIPFEDHDKHELPVAAEASSSKQADNSSNASAQQVSWKKGPNRRLQQ